MTRSVFSNRNREIRQRLVEERKRAKLTQAVLAKRLGRPQSFVSKYERGERRLDLVEFFEVAEAIGVDLNRFLRGLNRPAH